MPTPWPYPAPVKLKVSGMLSAVAGESGINKKINGR
jgi:hypothetical protein